MNNLSPICPHCGDVLIGEDTPDTEWVRGQYTDFVIGSCPTCDRRYIWNEVYILNRIEKITEIED